jgi:hypothetical protein
MTSAQSMSASLHPRRAGAPRKIPDRCETNDLPAQLLPRRAATAPRAGANANEKGKILTQTLTFAPQGQTRPGEEGGRKRERPATARHFIAPSMASCHHVPEGLCMTSRRISQDLKGAGVHPYGRAGINERKSKTHSVSAFAIRRRPCRPREQKPMKKADRLDARHT